VCLCKANAAKLLKMKHFHCFENQFIILNYESSSDSVVTDHKMCDRSSVLGRVIRFSLSCRFQTGAAVHPASFQKIPSVKRSRREPDHPPSSSAEVKKEWSHTSYIPYVFTAWCLMSTMETLLYLTYQLSTVKMFC
jgi:hypothetical protein